MSNANFRDPSALPCRIYVGRLNESVTQELLDIKFSPYGKIAGFLRTAPGFGFIQYEKQSSATNAIQSLNGSFLAGQKLIVNAAEMKSQIRVIPLDDPQPMIDESLLMNLSMKLQHHKLKQFLWS